MSTASTGQVARLMVHIQGIERLGASLNIAGSDDILIMACVRSSSVKDLPNPERPRYVI
jgi:hypothetical protein